jgi:hypothetical protein
MMEKEDFFRRLREFEEENKKMNETLSTKENELVFYKNQLMECKLLHLVLNLS